MKKLTIILLCLFVSGFCFSTNAQQKPTSQKSFKLPKLKGKFRKANLIEINKLDDTIKLDIRYATTNNFVGQAVYSEARAFLQKPAAESLVKVHRKLKNQGLGLVVFDGYRPWSVTKMFWEVTPEDKRMFVANPEKGSRHNRGCAVDLSLYNLKTGELLEMPSEFDEFSKRAHVNYDGATDNQKKNRETLRSAMEAEGFLIYEVEWWHFDHKDWREYPILDIQFSEVKSQ